MNLDISKLNKIVETNLGKNLVSVVRVVREINLKVNKEVYVSDVGREREDVISAVLHHTVIKIVQLTLPLVILQVQVYAVIDVLDNSIIDYEVIHVKVDIMGETVVNTKHSKQIETISFYLVVKELKIHNYHTLDNVSA